LIGMPRSVAGKMCSIACNEYKFDKSDTDQNFAPGVVLDGGKPHSGKTLVSRTRLHVDAAQWQGYLKRGNFLSVSLPGKACIALHHQTQLTAELGRSICADKVWMAILDHSRGQKLVCSGDMDGGWAQAQKQSCRDIFGVELCIE
jgi:hypothetical protein